MIETLFVLFLTMGGEPQEWTPHFTLSECLSVKRKIDRNVGSGHLFSCEKRTVELESSGPSNEYYIVKFVDTDTGKP